MTTESSPVRGNHVHIPLNIQARIQDFLKGGGGGGVMATRGGGVIGGDRPCRRKITI